MDEIVAQQVAAGIDIVSDGEMSKPSYTTYIRHRVERHRARSARRREGPRHHDRARSRWRIRILPTAARNFADTPFPGCVGPLRYKDRSALDRDLAHLKAAAGKVEARPTCS